MLYCYLLLKHICVNGQHWQGGKHKNIEIDLLQENRNKDIKGLISLMGANKTKKAIERVSRAAGGVEHQASIKEKSSAHLHRSSTEDENKTLTDLQKIKPFHKTPGRSHKSFVGISSDPLEKLNH